MIVPVLQVALNVVEEFAESERGAGGFGSTGKAEPEPKWKGRPEAPWASVLQPGA